MRSSLESRGVRHGGVASIHAWVAGYQQSRTETTRMEITDLDSGLASFVWCHC